MKTKNQTLFKIVCAVLMVVCVTDLLRITYVESTRTLQLPQEEPASSEVISAPAEAADFVTSAQPLMNQEDKIAFEGQQETGKQDNPWGTTAGIVDDEALGRCFFLTPNTGMIFGAKPEAAQKLKLGGMIYPAVQAGSDGCDLLVQIYSQETGKLLQEQKFDFTNKNDMQYYEMELSGVTNTAANFRLIVGNGGGNDVGDWLMLSEVIIE